jgi:hypothetical protein
MKLAGEACAEAAHEEVEADFEAAPPGLEAELIRGEETGNLAAGDHGLV